jgi:hypothetical protein
LSGFGDGSSRFPSTSCRSPSTEQKFAWVLASGFDVAVDGLPRLLRQFKPDGPPSLLLPHCGTINRVPAWCDILDPKCDDIAPRSLLSIARLNIAKSRVLPSICNRVRIDQTCFGLNGGFWPMNLPLFQGSLRGVEVVVWA